MTKSKATVIGGGLAGCEAAWQLAERGVQVFLFEMRPGLSTGAHVTQYLAELVCSNSLGSNLPNKASGMLKQELKLFKSMLLTCAEENAVPAGGALAVDRNAFSRSVTYRVESHPNIIVVREECTEIPDGPVIVASGPLTSSTLSTAISKYLGRNHLFFFDAISPIIAQESINMQIAFRSSRYSKDNSELPDAETGDYINCPFLKDEYYAFIDELCNAERIVKKEFEEEIDQGVTTGKHQFFEGCLPIEVLAQRGRDALAYGPMRPVGLRDPRTGKRPYAVVQLRQDNLIGTLYNIVGFQTNLTFTEQRRVFRMIPGLETAIFERYGQMHRNTFIFSPDLLLPSLQVKLRSDLFFAGQITGIEGYAGNIATGLLAGINCERVMSGKDPIVLPTTTMLGALCHYITCASQKDFQPMKANFGILPPLEDGGDKINRRERGSMYASRGYRDLRIALEKIGLYCV
jgi:methylenetetrahydrofolate--tRNA-(uracil-5-)-methyltransferase